MDELAFRPVPAGVKYESRAIQHGSGSHRFGHQTTGDPNACPAQIGAAGVRLEVRHRDRGDRSGSLNGTGERKDRLMIQRTMDFETDQQPVRNAAHMSDAHCPGCNHVEFRYVASNLTRCKKCGWLCRVEADGKIETALNLGKTVKRQISRSKFRRIGQ